MLVSLLARLLFGMQLIWDTLYIELPPSRLDGHKVRTDYSDPSSFQCICGRPVLKWPAVAVYNQLYLLRVLRSCPLQGNLQAGEKGRSHRGPNLVRQAGHCWGTVLEQQPPDRQAWLLGKAHCGGKEATNWTTFVTQVPIKSIPKASQDSPINSLSN